MSYFNNKTSSMYNELIFGILKENKVKEIICEPQNKDDKFFDRCVVKEDGLEVYSHGLKTPFSKFCFDFDIDFASMIFHIEYDLFCVGRGLKNKYGMTFKF